MNHDNGTNRVPPTTDDDAAYLAAAYTQAMTGDVTSTSTSTSTSTTTTTAPAESLPSYNLQDDYIDMSEPPITAAPPPPQTSSTTAPPPASHAAPSYGEVPTGSNGSTMPAATAAPPQPPGGLLEAALRDLNNMIPKDTQHAGLTISIILHCLCIIIALLSLVASPLLECLAMSLSILILILYKQNKDFTTAVLAISNVIITSLVCLVWFGVIIFLGLFSFGILLVLMVFLIPYVIVVVSALCSLVLGYRHRLLHQHPTL